MKKLHPVGIDVSAKELVVTSDRHRAARFDNDPAGHKKLIRALTKGGRCVRVVLEATGVYSLDLPGERWEPSRDHRRSGVKDLPGRV